MEAKQQGSPDLSAFEGVDFSQAERQQIVIIGSGPAGEKSADVGPDVCFWHLADFP